MAFGQAARKSVGWFLTILWKIKNNGVLPPKKREMHKLTYLLLKINMEPRNHPIEKEHHFPNLHYCVPRKFSRV